MASSSEQSQDARIQAIYNEYLADAHSIKTAGCIVSFVFTVLVLAGLISLYIGFMSLYYFIQLGDIDYLYIVLMFLLPAIMQAFLCKLPWTP